MVLTKYLTLVGSVEKYEDNFGKCEKNLSDNLKTDFAQKILAQIVKKLFLLGVKQNRRKIPDLLLKFKSNGKVYGKF